MENITEYQGKKYREVKRVAKVGELVKIVDAGNIPQTNGIDDYKDGDVLKIIGINSWSELPMYAKNIPQEYTDKVLNLSEYVVLEPIEQEFTLADLKPGIHVVKTREEYDNFGLVLNNGFSFKSSFMKKSSMIEDLTHLNDSGLDIIEVFEIIKLCKIEKLLESSNLKSVWKRIEKSPAQLKLEELENQQRKIADEIAEIKKGL